MKEEYFRKLSPHSFVFGEYRFSVYIDDCSSKNIVFEKLTDLRFSLPARQHWGALYLLLKLLLEIGFRATQNFIRISLMNYLKYFIHSDRFFLTRSQESRLNTVTHSVEDNFQIF